MRSNGQVTFPSRNGGGVVVRRDDGYSVVELIEDKGTLSAGDAVMRDWDALGAEPLFADDETLDAYFQGSWGSREAAIHIARKAGGG